MVEVDGAGIPPGDHLHAVPPCGIRLAEATLQTIRVGRRHHAGRPRQKPARVIVGRSYDCDPLRKQLARRGIELIAPRHKNRRNPPTQDGRALQAAMECGTHDRMARQLSPAGGTLRPLAYRLSSVLSYRLLHDRLTEGFEIPSGQRARASVVCLKGPLKKRSRAKASWHKTPRGVTGIRSVPDGQTYS